VRRSALEDDGHMTEKKKPQSPKQDRKSATAPLIYTWGS